MIIGLGLDLVELARIANVFSRFGERFAQKLLHKDELALLPALHSSAANTKIIEHLASRMAAKEAGVKALGTGFSQGIHLHDLRIIPLPSGQPTLTLHGDALKQADYLAKAIAPAKNTTLAWRIHLSITHTGQNAAAVVVLEV